MQALRTVAVAAVLGLVASNAEAVITKSTGADGASVSLDGSPRPREVMGAVRIDRSGPDGMGAGDLSPYAGRMHDDLASRRSDTVGRETRYLFDGARDASSFVLDSPDSYSSLSLRLRGEQVFEMPGKGLLSRKAVGPGAVYVMVRDILFDEIRFAAPRRSADAAQATRVATVRETGNSEKVAGRSRALAPATLAAFEPEVAARTPGAHGIADVVVAAPVAAVPLPAALSMLFGALAVLGLASRPRLKV